ncbi:TraB/GumN family protein [Shewanella sp. KX20019]|uniref:TraB/GumN family protein n=1 Tax=Shewanella sp. KX20019 TaxID=2803864 RepID=UPI00192519E8|nr:TraB/GumN family protein [Shewanella sp. KX20019]QQX79683.1 TraB/GumN family protein [Shewanella sp. KX20019]
MLATSIQKGLLSIVGAFCLFLAQIANAAPTDKPPFYQVSYQGQTAYLLGSIHIGKADFYPLADQIEQAFAKSKALVVEADVRDANVPALLQKYGADKLPMDDKTKVVLADYCKDKAALCTALSSYAPWLQSMQLSIGRYTALGYSALYGVDSVLVAQADNRPVYELESTKFQFELLSSFTPETQWEMVREAIEAPDEDMLKLISAWRRGDEAELADLMEGEMLREGNIEMVERMLWNRNKGMAKKMVELMSSSTTVQPLFVVVGAGHLVGEQSVQSYLTTLGANSKNCWDSICN